MMRPLLPCVVALLLGAEELTPSASSAALVDVTAAQAELARIAAADAPFEAALAPHFECLRQVEMHLLECRVYLSRGDTLAAGTAFLEARAALAEIPPEVRPLMQPLYGQVDRTMIQVSRQLLGEEPPPSRPQPSASAPASQP